MKYSYRGANELLTAGGFFPKRDHNIFCMGQYVLSNPSFQGSSSSILGCDEIWGDAEQKNSAVLNQIQPSIQSEECRKDVINHIEYLLETRLNCKVFSFGSVPLKTYLPDGDIDLTVIGCSSQFDQNHHFWAEKVCKVLENEEHIHVKEVKCIHAEVPVVKCLVENIIVDITFNQLGGLSTLCFLEEVDKLIGQNHLFKKSIILVKAWCFYESRILGAHYGLLSTYALEVLVLYIFQVYNKSLRGPLQVLYRFLQYFSKFDWDKFCLTPWGPVSLDLLQDFVEVLPDLSEGGFLLSYKYLSSCRQKYRTHSESNQGKAFSRKYMNLVDPLRPFNNLGRSVNSGNLVRMYSAFAFGASQLEKLLQSPSKLTCDSLAQFFCNTQKHCEGQRPDAGALSFQVNMLSNETGELILNGLPASEVLDHSKESHIPSPKDDHMAKFNCRSSNGEDTERPACSDVSFTTLPMNSGEKGSVAASFNEAVVSSNGAGCYQPLHYRREDLLRNDNLSKEKHVGRSSIVNGRSEMQCSEKLCGVNASFMGVNESKAEHDPQKYLNSPTIATNVNSASSETGSVSSAEETAFGEQVTSLKSGPQSQRNIEMDMSTTILEGNLGIYLDNLKSGWAYQDACVNTHSPSGGFLLGDPGRSAFSQSSRVRNAPMHGGVSFMHGGTILGTLPKSQKGTGTFLPSLNSSNERQKPVYSMGVRSPRRNVVSLNPFNHTVVPASKSRSSGPKRRDGPNRARFKKNGDLRFGENEELTTGVPVRGGLISRLDNASEPIILSERILDKWGDAQVLTPSERSWRSQEADISAASKTSSKDTPIEKLEFGSFGPDFLATGLKSLPELSQHVDYVSRNQSFLPLRVSEASKEGSHNGHQKSFYCLREEDFPPLS